jgi:hypothetical protein
LWQERDPIIERVDSADVIDMRYLRAVGMADPYVAAFLQCAGVVGVSYGFLNVVHPSLTIRWQVRSTAKHDDYRRTVGTLFQQVLAIDPTADPRNDARAKRRVRWFGAFEIVLFGSIVMLVGIWRGSA